MKLLKHVCLQDQVILLGAVLAAIIAIGFVAAAMPVAPQSGVGISTQSQQSSANASTVLKPSSSTPPQSAQSVLVIQLTDPPIVPQGTTSLNLTYSAINLLVTEPSTVTSTSTSLGPVLSLRQAWSPGTSTVTSTTCGGSNKYHLQRWKQQSERSGNLTHNHNNS